MTNVGFGEVNVTKRGPVVTLGALVAMLGGITFTSIFIGSVSSALTRAEFTLTQGLRRVRARGHIVVCGGGSVPAATLAVLTGAGKRAVVIDPEPDAGLVRRARERNVDLLTGDPVSDDALDLCAIPNATAVLALTASDAENLEIALGARARCATIPLVVRMEGDAFAPATQSFSESPPSPSQHLARRSSRRSRACRRCALTYALLKRIMESPNVASAPSRRLPGPAVRSIVRLAR